MRQIAARAEAEVVGARVVVVAIARCAADAAALIITGVAHRAAVAVVARSSRLRQVAAGTEAKIHGARVGVVATARTVRTLAVRAAVDGAAVLIVAGLGSEHATEIRIAGVVRAGVVVGAKACEVLAAEGRVARIGGASIAIEARFADAAVASRIRAAIGVDAAEHRGGGAIGLRSTAISQGAAVSVVAWGAGLGRIVLAAEQRVAVIGCARIAVIAVVRRKDAADGRIACIVGADIEILTNGRRVLADAVDRIADLSGTKVTVIGTRKWRKPAVRRGHCASQRQNPKE